MIWGYILIAYVSLFALGVSDNIRGPLYPEVLKAFQVSDTRGALFFAATSLLGFCGSFIVRFLLRVLTRVRTLQIAMALMTISLAGMAWSPTFEWLLIFAGSFGFSLGLVGVVQNVLVTLGSSVDRRHRMMSGLHSTYGVAALLAPLTVALMTSVFHSWRAAPLAAASIAGAVFLGSLFMRETHSDSQPKADQKLQHKRHGWQTHAGQMYISLAMSLYVLVEILVASRLALYLRRDFAVDLTTSTYYVTGFFVCLLVGRLTFTFFDFKIRPRNMLSLSLAASVGFLVLGLTYTPWFLMFSGLTMAPFYPMTMSYISHHYQNSLDSAISTTLAMAYLMTVAMHELVGYLTDVYGISKALWVGPAALIIALLLLNSFEALFQRQTK